MGRKLAFVTGGTGVAAHGRRGAACARRRQVVTSVQPAPVGSQAIDFVFIGGFLALAIGAGLLLRNGFDADITNGPNRTEGLNLKRVKEYNPSVTKMNEDDDEYEKK
mmetsp:Transcript_10302/g.31502  ORF Transcript_10302/g.31502 Transcript_10302/m.31502 type:complete len:107 (-) Transcript_10302:96-416(-)|eukprot:CAMPEP_0198725546 /NCGR_PEP_ID=MMETSP1475-20131203/2836_1 /TAXON_ID= ORGANISM="Unidentified sp., Strain CCMP1999" /NCGR_SAMPLE_ID=MMETSP1475 /ASSEMBLY_ACC=CAM_ASM_001111 /LENGTH=106 /DNA_ID=CAMNT_0044487341 /DNA_START=218 /DNA_END=538 /DNA_ORIENTATION=-